MSNTIQTYSIVAAATVNSTNVTTKACRLLSVNLFHINDAPVYLKFYDMAGLPGATDTPKLRYGVPANSTAALGSGNNIEIPKEGINFFNGLCFRIVKGIADTDATAVDASEVLLTLTYQDEP